MRRKKATKGQSHRDSDDIEESLDYVFGERNWIVSKESSSKQSKGKGDNGGTLRSSKTSKQSRIADVFIEGSSARSKGGKDSKPTAPVWSESKIPDKAKNGSDASPKSVKEDSGNTNPNASLALKNNLAKLKSQSHEVGSPGNMPAMDNGVEKKSKMNEELSGVIMPETGASLKDFSGDDGEHGAFLSDQNESKKAFGVGDENMVGMTFAEKDAATKKGYTANDESDAASPSTRNESYAQVPSKGGLPIQNLQGQKNPDESPPEYQVPALDSNEKTSSRIGPYLMTLLYASIFLGALFAAIWTLRRWALKEDESEAYKTD